MRYRWLGWAHTETFSSAAVPGVEWRAGEVHEIPEDAAAYLSATYPEAFVEVEPDPPAKPSRKRGR